MYSCENRGFQVWPYSFFRPLGISDAFLKFSYFMPVPHKVKLPVVLGIVRLAHKYDVQYLLRRALQHLASEFPSQLEDYFRPGSIHIGDDAKISTCLDVIKLATAVDASSIFPAAYYKVCAEGPGVASLIESGGAHWQNLAEEQ